MTIIKTAEDDPIADEGIDLFGLLCQRRGWTDEYLAAIESEEHDELLDLDRMVEALHSARTSGAQITIAPDFDMDGIASGVLGYAGLSELGFNVKMHLPDYNRGHNLSPEDIAEIHQRFPDTQALLTCDGGVNSHEGVAAARALGWTTLVTDHHAELEPGSTADVTVNPCRLDETYAHPGICGAHVLYQVLDAYARTHNVDKLWEIKLLKLFAGLGTVSDVMPVIYENRQLVRDSLSISRLLWVAAPKPNGPYGDAEPHLIDVETSTLMQLLRVNQHHPVYVRAFRGFALMLKAFTQTGKLRDVDSLNEGFYGFYMAPAMNSPRRTGEPLEPCFQVFTASTSEEMLEAAHVVILGNEMRKELVIEHFAELEEGDQPLAPWVYFSKAPAGMYGLLANKMMHRAGHPTVVVNRPRTESEFVSGSGRAPEWFDIITSLEPHAGLSAIGHQQACGVKVERADLLDELVTVLREATEVALLAVDTDAPRGDLVLGPDDDCDAGLDDLDPLFELVHRTESLKPYGHGFTEPVIELAIEPMGLRVDRIGTERQHLRLVTRGGLSCLWWNSADEQYEKLDQLVHRASRTQIGTLRFTAKLQLNTFRGETRIQAVINEHIVPA